MSTNTTQESGNHIAELVEFAARAGQPDVYTGKRCAPRYRVKMPMEIRRREEPVEAAVSVELHDISLSGFGFWSEHEFKQYTKMLVREWKPLAEAEWIEAKIVHCTRGLTGFLVGACFEKPKPRAADSEVIGSETDVQMAVSDGSGVYHLPNPPAVGHSATPDSGPSRPARPARPKQKLALRSKCVVLSIAGTLVGVVAALVILFTLGRTLAPWAALPIAAVVTCAVSGIVMWLSLGDETRFFAALKGELAAPSSNGHAPAARLAAAPTSDLEGLDSLLERLRTEIGRHHDATTQQKQRMAALEEVESTILNVIAHDLRTPLTSILLYAELMRSELHKLDTSEQEHCLQVITVETQRLSRLIDNLLHAEKISSGQFALMRTQVELPRLIQETLQDFKGMAQNRGIALETECDPQMPGFECDAGQVAQIVSNLVANAMKFTPRGGCVHVYAEMHPHEVLLSVSDNGPGIPRAQWDRIFNRFTQVEPSFLGDSPGVGIGLFVVSRIVDRLGGRVWVDSEVGRGSEFCVVLPRTPIPADELPPDGQTPRGRVLVCDFDPALTARVAQLIRQKGFAVEAAYCGKRLLEKLDENDYDVVFSDILLHDVSPKNLLAKLCDPQRKFKFIAHTHATQAAELRQLGVDIILGRPADKTELVEAVQTAINLRPNCATIMIVAPPEHELCDFGRKLAAEGHLPVVVHDLSEAGAQLRDYPFDRVLVAESLLDSDWRRLHPLLEGAATPETVVVACAAVGRSERALAGSMGVGAAAIPALVRMGAAVARAGTAS